MTAFLTTSPIAARAGELCAGTSSEKTVLKEVANGIFVREGAQQIMSKENLAGIANISFVVGKKSIAVIDTGGSYCDGLKFKAALRTKSDLPISYVINTHTHPDHIFGNAAFENEGAVFIGHHKLKRAIEERGPLYLENLKRLLGDEAMRGVKIITPTETVNPTKVIDLGERTLTLTAHKTAHTDHDLTIFDETTKTIWTGDLLFEGHIPVIDGSILGWMKLMDELAKKEANHVVPGHGILTMKWPAALDKQNQYFANLAKDLRKIINDGGTMLDAQKTAGKSEKPKWILFGEFNARNASAAFAELEWE